MINRVGFKKSSSDKTEYYVFVEMYKKEICAGYDQKTVTKVLIDAEWILVGSDGKSTIPKSLPEMTKTRCYVFTSKMWED